MTDILTVRSEYRMQEWIQIIQQCKESGLSNKEFCQQRGIAEKTYYYWLRKIRESAIAAEQPQLVALEESIAKSEGKLVIQFRGARLELPEEIELESVLQMLQALQKI